MTMVRAVLHCSSIDASGTGFNSNPVFIFSFVLEIDPDFEYVVVYGRSMAWDRGKSVRQCETT